MTLTRRALLASLGTMGFGSLASSQERPQGLVRPQVFPPFDPDLPACKSPPDLERILVFAQDNQRQFMQGVDRGLAAAARDRNLKYRVARADNDPVRMITDVQEALRSKVGALIAAPIDAAMLGQSLKEMIWNGAYVGTIVPPPAISLLNAPQFLTGKVLGDAAAEYIVRHLAGKARVVLLTHDTNQFLAQRFVAMRQSLKRLPGVTIIADISPLTVDKEGGFAMMNTILLAHKQIDVVLGADTVVLGALSALRAAGRARSDQFLGGIDGEPEAVAELKKGGEYKASVSLASPIFAYAMGSHAADWLEGKSIPQAMDILPVKLSRENIAQYEGDLAKPGTVFADPVRRSSYLRMYGNICFDTRDRFVNFAWSSERK
jgi:ribose transport system substrate-binding protein